MTVRAEKKYSLAIQLKLDQDEKGIVEQYEIFDMPICEFR